MPSFALGWAFFLLVVNAGAPLRAQTPRLEGNPLLRPITHEQMGVVSRTNAIVRDAGGYLYFGSSEGVLRYDGRRWQLIVTPAEVTTLALGPDSLVYWGGRGQYGRIEPIDSLARQLGAVSLTPERTTRATLGDVISLHPLDATALAVVTTKGVSRYVVGEPRGRALKAPSPTHDINGAFVHNRTLYVNLSLAGDDDLPCGSPNQGLYAYVNDAFQCKPYSGDSSRLFVRTGLPWRGGQTLVATTDGRLLAFDGSTFSPLPLSEQVSEYLGRAGLTSAARVGESYLAIGTASGGAMVLSISANYTRLDIASVLNLQGGLPDNEISALGADLEGGLWVAHGQGVARLFLSYPFRDYSIYGSLGLINDIATLGDQTYIATNSGVYRLAPNYSRAADSDEAVREQTQKVVATEKEALIQQEIASRSRVLQDEAQVTIEATADYEKYYDNLRAKVNNDKKLSKKQREDRLKEINDRYYKNFKTDIARRASIRLAQLRIDREKVEKEVRAVYDLQIRAETESKLSSYFAAKRGKPLPRIEYLGGYKFERVRGLESKCLDLQLAQGELLAATSSGLFRVRTDRAEPIWQPEGLALAQLYVMPSRPTWLLVGSTQGVQRFQYAEGRWADQGAIPGLEASVLSMAEGERGHLLVSTTDGPVYRLQSPLDPRDPLSAEVVVDRGSARAVVLRTLMGRAMAFSRKGDYLADYDGARFTPHVELQRELAQQSVLAEADLRSLWRARGNHLYRLTIDGQRITKRDTIAWTSALSEPITLIAPVPRSQAVWLVAGGRLLQLMPQAEPPKPPARLRPSIALLAAAGDSTFDPQARPLFQQFDRPWWQFWAQLPDQLEARDVSVEVTAPLYAELAGAQVRYRLIGPERLGNWSEWTAQPRLTLSGLKAGTYRLEVQVRDLFGRIYTPTRGTEINLPQKLWEYPWFRWSALALGLLTVGGGTWRFVRWRTATLEKKNRELEAKAKELNAERERLLHNILPPDIARELEQENEVVPKLHKQASVLFTDFKGFTTAAAAMKPKELVEELNTCFSAFDAIVERYHLEKIKTIGDAYMAAAGVPQSSGAHALEAVMAGLAIQRQMADYMSRRRSRSKPQWELRLGIHSGPLVAGVIGTKKFAYDVWGDTVNTAARMESSGEVNRVNISADTYALVKDVFI